MCALEEEETPSHDALFIAAACDAAGGRQLQAEEEAEVNHSTQPKHQLLLYHTLLKSCPYLSFPTCYLLKNNSGCSSLRHHAPCWPQKKLIVIYRATYRPYPFLTAANNEVGFYVVLFQVGVPVPSCPGLHVVVPVQIVESGLGDVDASEGTESGSRVSGRLQ